ncbi:MAG: TonB-dependent receptor [Xanthomonadaceae bacterium]|jgi:iron complex outermembrane receptor protein|nr:TonB-dependent receptor [Xanthomonadaceae bacterium]
MRHRYRPLAAAVAFTFSGFAIAQTTNMAPVSGQLSALPKVDVTAYATDAFSAANTVDSDELSRMRAATSDTATLLQGIPGVNVQSAGSVSGLPSIHGLGDDRLSIRVNGMDLVSACTNHMNPPLSYIDPTNIQRITVYTGITPVSVGGDSIGGAIVIDSKPPQFANPGEGMLTSGEVGGFYRSNGDAHGGNASIMLATEHLNIRYAGSTAQSNNYRAARSFKPGLLAEYTTAGRHWIRGDEVASSAYKSQNHQLGIASRWDHHLFDLKLGYQHIPYQGFPNQHMDMSDNKSRQVNFNYQGDYQWGTLDARIYHERTTHSMNFLKDRVYWYHISRVVPGMPMNTEGKNLGTSVQAEILPSQRDVIRIGGEYQRYRLDDWWPPSYGIVNGSPVGGMQPNTFWNIRNGQRDRFDLYGEWEAMWTPRWTTLLGARAATVRMNSGRVSGYNDTYATDANRFNQRDRSRTDDNINLSAIVRFTPDDRQSYQGGYSRKVRSPSLYERYTWSTGGMAMTMNNWVNDGNGYVGNLDLVPEIAHTVSLTANWHDAGNSLWNVEFTPYYSLIDHYIDARCLRTLCPVARYNFLTVVNQSARLYGADLSGSVVLGEAADVGRFTFKGNVSYVNGKNRTSGDHLYNIMPLNARLVLEHRLGNWTNTIEQQLVAAKRNVSEVRNEMETAGYGLLNLRSSYLWKNVRLDIGLENALDKHYALPLGGAYIGQGATMSLGMTSNWSATGQPPYGYTVPGMGRSLYAGINIAF